MELKIISVKYITKLDDFNDVVISIDWEYDYNDHLLSGTLETEKPSFESFIPINDLTVEMFQSWVTEKMNFEEKHASIDDMVKEDPNKSEIKTIEFDYSENIKQN